MEEKLEHILWCLNSLFQARNKRVKDEYEPSMGHFLPDIESQGMRIQRGYHISMYRLTPQKVAKVPPKLFKK